MSATRHHHKQRKQHHEVSLNNHSLRSFLPTTTPTTTTHHQSSKRRLSTFSTPATTSDHRPPIATHPATSPPTTTSSFRQSVLRRGKTVLRRAVTSATSSFTMRNNSSLGHSHSTPSPRPQSPAPAPAAPPPPPQPTINAVVDPTTNLNTAPHESSGTHPTPSTTTTTTIVETLTATTAPRLPNAPQHSAPPRSNHLYRNYHTAPTTHTDRQTPAFPMRPPGVTSASLSPANSVASPFAPKNNLLQQTCPPHDSQTPSSSFVTPVEPNSLSKPMASSDLPLPSPIPATASTAATVDQSADVATKGAAKSAPTSNIPQLTIQPSVSTAASTVSVNDAHTNDQSSTVSAPASVAHVPATPSATTINQCHPPVSTMPSTSTSTTTQPPKPSLPSSSDRPDKRALSVQPRARTLNRRFSLSDHPTSASNSRNADANSSHTHSQRRLSQRSDNRPSLLPDPVLRRHTSTTSTSTSASQQRSSNPHPPPPIAQTYLHHRRTSVPSKPSSHTLASSPPVQVTSPAARARDISSHPAHRTGNFPHGRLQDPANLQSAHGTRVSKTGFMERSVAAAVISAARHRTQHAKKARQPSPPKPPHHRLHGGFANPWPSALKDSGLRSRGASGSRTFFHKVAKDNRRPPDEQLATMLLLALRPDFTASADAVRRDKYTLASTWIGHSTFYLHARGLTVLTDPVWSSRLGPLGPKRLVPPPCSIEDLPPRIDVVILSSACYDHYDKNAIQMLLSRVGQWLVPLGLKPLLVSLGVQKDLAVELDWWDEHDVHGSRFVCTPSQHHSVREDTLWCSWVVHAPYHRFFYCGATGYRSINRDAEDSNAYDSRVRFGGPSCPAFKEIGRRLGPFDTAFLPIGGFKPRVLTSGVQGDAVDMLFVHQDVGARRSIAHRWGTFQNNDEGMLDSIRMLEFALQTGPVSEHEFIYLKHGRLHLT